MDQQFISWEYNDEQEAVILSALMGLTSLREEHTKAESCPLRTVVKEGLREEVPFELRPEGWVGCTWKGWRIFQAELSKNKGLEDGNRKKSTWLWGSREGGEQNRSGVCTRPDQTTFRNAKCGSFLKKHPKWKTPLLPWGRAGWLPSFLGVNVDGTPMLGKAGSLPWEYQYPLITFPCPSCWGWLEGYVTQGLA